MLFLVSSVYGEHFPFWPDHLVTKTKLKERQKEKEIIKEERKDRNIENFEFADIGCFALW